MGKQRSGRNRWQNLESLRTKTKTRRDNKNVRLHRNATVVDAHSDYALQVLRERLRGKTHVMEKQHLPKLRAGGVKVEVHTVGGDFVLSGIDCRDPRTVLRVFDCIHCEVAESPHHFALVRQKKDFDDIIKKGKIALLLALEGAAAIGDDFSLLRIYYRLGLRSLILTHNERNFAADGCGEKPAGGLSKLGKDLIREANKLNMILDLVHIAEPGFFDVLELTEKVPLVSHSNVKALCDHFRNLTDRQIRAVAERGGVIGLNFLCFMVDRDVRKAKLGRLLDHVDYIAELVGIDHVGLGPDYADYYIEVLEDWLARHNYPLEMAKYVEGVEDVTGLARITEGLAARGYSDQDIRKVLGENFLRVYKEVLD